MPQNYWFNLDMSVVSYNDENISLTFKDSNGDPLVITGWLNMTYKASAAWTTDVIEVAHAAMTKTSSGSGSTDRVIIPISASDSAITQGLYNHEFSVEIASQDRTIFRGTIRILDRVAEVP